MSKGETRSPATSNGVPHHDADAEMQLPGTARSMTEAKPAWLDQFAWSLLGKVVVVFLATALLWGARRELRHLLWLLVVSSFFAVAMIPGVEHLHRRWQWRRRGRPHLCLPRRVRRLDGLDSESGDR
jgi:hypothetical protein